MMKLSAHDAIQDKHTPIEINAVKPSSAMNGTD